MYALTPSGIMPVSNALATNLPIQQRFINYAEVEKFAVWNNPLVVIATTSENLQEKYPRMYRYVKNFSGTIFLALYADWKRHTDPADFFVGITDKNPLGFVQKLLEIFPEVRHGESLKKYLSIEDFSLSKPTERKINPFAAAVIRYAPEIPIRGYYTHSTIKEHGGNVETDTWARYANAKYRKWTLSQDQEF